MGKENEERLFSEKLDRLLAGEETQTDAGMDNDLQTALDFAGKMKSLRDSPSSQFKANLKARLLQELDERETRAEAQGWLARLVRQPVWQAVAVLVLMIVVGGGIMWRAGVFNPSGTGTSSAPKLAIPAPTAAAPMTTAVPAPSIAVAVPPAATTAATTTTAPASTTGSAGFSADMYLTASASTDKSAYQPGETINIHMEWQNLTSQNLTIDEYPPILSIIDKSTGQVMYTFQAGKGSITLAAGQKADYTESWNQLNTKGRLVEPGTYYLELEEIYYQGESGQMTLSKPVSFIIY